MGLGLGLGFGVGIWVGVGVGVLHCLFDMVRMSSLVYPDGIFSASTNSRLASNVRLLPS